MAIIESLMQLAGYAGAALALVFALPAALKNWKEFSYMQRAHRRAEHDFALAFSKTLDAHDPHIKRYAHELAYAAMVGDRDLNYAQRKVLLAMPNAEQRIREYLKVAALLTVSTTEQTLVWKSKNHQNSNYRKVVHHGAFIAYLVFILGAMLPWLFWGNFDAGSSTLKAGNTTLLMITLYCLPSAIFFLVHSVKIDIAQRLIKAIADEAKPPSA